MIGLIISAVLFSLIALAVLVGCIKGSKYVWQYSLSRLIINLIAVIIAIPVTKFVSKLIAKYVINMIPLEAEGFSVSSLLGEILIVLMAMILGLFLFCAVRLIIKFILKFFAPAIARLLLSITESKKGEDGETDDAISDTEEIEERPHKKHSKREGCYATKAQPVSILISVVGCVLGVVVLFAPFTGLAGMINNTLEDAQPMLAEVAEDEEDVVEIYNMATEATGCAGIKFANACGGKLIYNGLTSYKTEGIKMKLKNELNLLATIADSISIVLDETAEKQEKTGAINNILDAFDDSAIIPIVLSNAVNAAAEAIENGEEFMGITTDTSAENQNETPEIGDRLVVALVDTFKGCTPVTIKEDVRTLGSFVVIFIEHDAIDKIKDDPEKLLGEDALIEELLGEFLANDRLSSLVSFCLEIGMEALYEALGVADTLEEPHQNLQTELGNIQDQIPGDLTVSPVSNSSSNTDKKVYEIKTEKDLKKYIRQVFNANGIDITDAGVNEVASKLVSKAPVTDALKNVEVKAKGAGGEAKSVDLNSLETFENTSLLLTKKDIQISHKTGITDPKKEAKLLASTLSTISKITEKLDGEDENKVTAVLEVAGELLDNLANTELIGKDTVDNLVVVVFQSEMATETLGGNVVAVTNAVNSMFGESGNNADGADSTKYKDAMSNVAGMVDTMTGLADSENQDPEAIIEKLAETLKGMSSETAMATKHIMGNSEFVEKLGIPAENADGVASLIGNLFDNIATARKPVSEGGLGLSQAEYDEETGFIADLLKTMIDSSENDEEPGEDKMQSYYKNALDSKIITHTITSSVLDNNGNVKTLNPFNIDTDFDGEDEKDFVEGLNEQLTERIAEINESTDIADKDTAKKDAVDLAVAVAAFLGVTTTHDYANGSVVLVSNS